MDTLLIQTAKVTDIPLLVELSTQTFYDTYRESHLWSDLEHYVKNNLTETNIKRDLNNEHICYLLLFLNDEAIGYAKLNTTGSYERPAQSKNPLEIARIYLVKSAQGKGYGKVLMEATVQYAIQHKHDAIYLGVWEGNIKAIQFYNSYGFTVYSKTLFPLESTIDTDLLMFKQLTIL